MSNPAATSSASAPAIVRPHRKSRRDRIRIALTSIGASLAWLLAPAMAFADAKEECSDALYETQVLRDADKLQEAIQKADVCARDVCAKFVRDECMRWKSELEGRIASVIVEAVDASGAPLADGTVTLDGAPWLERLDGAPRVVSKGPHTLVVSVKGAPPQERKIVVVEGEKNRRISVPIPGAKLPDPEPPSDVHRVGPWIVGGVGMAALIGGAVTGIVVVDAYSTMKEECSDETESCRSQAGADAQDRGRVLGPVTTSLLVGGGVLVAAGIVWLILAPDETKPSKTSLFVVPVLSSEQQGVVVGGAW